MDGRPCGLATVPNSGTRTGKPIGGLSGAAGQTTAEFFAGYAKELLINLAVSSGIARMIEVRFRLAPENSSIRNT